MRTEDLGIKHLLQKKILKPQFLDLLIRIFQAFPHNEHFLHLLVQLVQALHSRPDFYLVADNYDFQGVIGFIMDYLLIYKPEPGFFNKKKLQTLLRFLLRYVNVHGSDGQF